MNYDGAMRYLVGMLLALAMLQAQNSGRGAAAYEKLCA